MDALVHLLPPASLNRFGSGEARCAQLISRGNLRPIEGIERDLTGHVRTCLLIASGCTAVRIWDRGHRGHISSVTKRKLKRTILPEWGLQITSLRERLGINQAELARRMECSAMTISRWERGLLQPSAEHFIQLGNLADKSEAWFFWEMGGVRPAKVLDALRSSPRAEGMSGILQRIDHHQQDQAAKAGRAPLVALPLLRATLGTHGQPGDRRSSLRAIPASSVLTIPASWCPNPAYTSLLRVKGHSMDPVLHHGDLVAVDSFQTERRDLYGELVVVANGETGLSVSRLRRYDTLDVLEAENRQYDPVFLNKTTGWRIVGKVLWWISGTA